MAYSQGTTEESMMKTLSQPRESADEIERHSDRVPEGSLGLLTDEELGQITAGGSKPGGAGDPGTGGDGTGHHGFG
jgi:hypothetical protein